MPITAVGSRLNAAVFFPPLPEKGPLTSVPPPPPDPTRGLVGLLEKVALNPQPLPPKSQYMDDFWCGTVPHRLPFPPPPPPPWEDIAARALSFR